MSDQSQGAKQKGEEGNPRGEALEEETLRVKKIEVEHKTFILSLKKNVKGRFLRVTEDVNGKRNSIIVPASGLRDFRDTLGSIIKHMKKNNPPPYRSKNN